MSGFWMLVTAAMAQTGGDDVPPAIPIAPARDGDIAIGEELQKARRTRRIADYDLFLARHPDHPLAKVARKERDCLARRAGR